MDSSCTLDTEQATHLASPQALQGVYSAAALEATYELEMALLTFN